MNNATVTAHGRPCGHDVRHEQHDQDQPGGCLPKKWIATVCGTRPEPGSLLLMSSTSMNAVDARRSGVTREKTVAN